MTVVSEKGLKRICTHCGTRFYDFLKRPIICPACETEFKGEIKLRSRRGRSAAQDLHEEEEEEIVVPVAGQAKGDADSADNDDDADDTLVSLETLEEDDEDDDTLGDLDDDLDDDLGVGLGASDDEK